MTSVCTGDLPVSKETTTVCEYPNWDSGLFGIRIGKAVGNCLDAERAGEILHWARQYSVDCLYFLADDELISGTCVWAPDAVS